jgi:hypothetical protein
MNRKDLAFLMEAYEEISVSKDLPIDDIDGDEQKDSISIGNPPEVPEHSTEEMIDNEKEKYRMVHAHLCTIRSHAHEIKECIENGANVDPWMEEKIAIANDYIVHVANAIMYRK